MAGEPFKECFDPNLKVQLWVWYSICLDRLGRIAIFPIEKWRVISRSSVVEERRIRFAQTFDACQTVRLEIEIFSLRNRERELYPNFLLATISNKILRSIFELWETNKFVVEKYWIWFAIKRISASVDRSGKKTCSRRALLIYLLPYDRCDT